MCGGVTMFAPLKAYETGPGKTVGIVGVGGLGHYGVLLAKAMGAKVIGISRKESKRAEVLGLGADDYIATDDDKDWAQKHFRSMDLIVSTVASSKVSEGMFHSSRIILILYRFPSTTTSRLSRRTARSSRLVFPRMELSLSLVLPSSLAARSSPAL